MVRVGVNPVTHGLRFFITLLFASALVFSTCGVAFAFHSEQPVSGKQPSKGVVLGVQDRPSNKSGIFESLKKLFSGLFTQADSQKPKASPRPVQTPTLTPAPVAPSPKPTPTPTPTPAPSPAPAAKEQSTKSSGTQFLPLSGGKITGKSTFNKELTLLEGFRVGGGGLVVNASGALTAREAIKVGDVEIIGKDGKIASFTSNYFGSLDGSALTNVNAAKINGVAAAALLRSDEGDTAEGALKFTAKPTGSGVGDGPVYVNPASASANDILLGIAVNGTSKFKVDAEGDIVVAGDLQLSDDLASSATTFNLLNSTVETLNFAGGATTVNLADSTATKTIDIGGVTASGTDTVNIATHRTNADIIDIGNDNASTTTAITGGDDWKITGTGLLTLSASASQTTAIDITDSDYTNALSIADNLILGTTASIDLTNFDVTGSSGDITTGGDIAVNGGDLTTTAATFNVANAATTANLGSTNIARTINVGTGTDIDTLNIGTGATGVDVIRIGQAAADLALTDANWSITTAGLITTADDAAINGGDVTTTAATFNLANAATTLNLGSTNVTRTIAIGTGTSADTINIGTGGTTADSISIGTGAVANTIAIGSSSATTVSITDDNWSITAAGAGTLVSLNLGGTTILDVLSSTTANVVAANVPTIVCATYATLTLTGAVAGDTAIATPTAVTGGIETLNLSWSAYATTDAVVIRACNPTAAGIDAADTQTWRAEVIRH